ncbi:FYRN-domain-containing protein [Lichtheimia hyalospora FSU 10163]|nr:FYRN-domain-containing protein [Lichtheimia hyalospora FSU 10163]
MNPSAIDSPSVQAEDSFSEDGYKQLKRKLREIMEINDTMSKQYIRAKKKIRTLTFERNVLLDNIGRTNPLSDDDSSDIPSGISDADSDLDELLPLHSSKAIRRRVTSQPSSSASPIESPSRKQTRDMATVASAPPKRSKISRVAVKTRRVQPIDRDENGQPRLPQQIGVLTVHDLGRIVSDRDTFHNERYIFPVGYTVSRTYPSMVDPANNTVITSTILDGGDGPRFHVVAADMPDQPIIANSATGAWTVVVRRSNEIRSREHSNSASGPDYYGFKHPTIAKLIQDLPGTDKLRYYVAQNFEEMEPRAAKGVMAAAVKKRSNIEQLGNANRRAPREDESGSSTGGGPIGDETVIQDSENTSVVSSAGGQQDEEMTTAPKMHNLLSSSPPNVSSSPSTTLPHAPMDSSLSSDLPPPPSSSSTHPPPQTILPSSSEITTVPPPPMPVAQDTENDVNKVDDEVDQLDPSDEEME